MKDSPKLYWIDGPWSGRLAVAARPRDGDWLEDEIGGWREAGVDVVASLLVDDEVEDLGLTEEPAQAVAHSMRYVSLPIPDRETPPSQKAAITVARQLADELERGHNVVVHCRQGIGRSASIAALVLAVGGLGPEDALRRIRDARGLEVPETEPQRVWVYRVAPMASATAITRIP